ncbi:hypothetical protein Fmac_001373 [Flemingia macrophylla]|uniref:Uncharacterized protein n=1 Tax=Flemingia macrophylla TaxID=520843 RepID=A0ABD1NIJ6_9FABA
MKPRAASSCKPPEGEDIQPSDENFNRNFLDVQVHSEQESPRADSDVGVHVHQNRKATLEDSNEGDLADCIVDIALKGKDTVLDIDTWEANNPLALVDYVEDLYGYYRTTEGAERNWQRKLEFGRGVKSASRIEGR